MGRPFEWDNNNRGLCHGRCGTIKSPPCSKAIKAEHRPKLQDDFSIRMFGCYSRTSNFQLSGGCHQYRWQGLSLALTAFNSEGSFTWHTYYYTGPRFIRSHPKDRHPRPTVRFKPTTHILKLEVEQFTHQWWKYKLGWKIISISPTPKPLLKKHYIES
jgi:hypothetical protein